MKQIFSAVLAALFVISSVTLPSLPAQAGLYNLSTMRELGQTLDVAGEKLAIKYGLQDGENVFIQVANKSGEVLKNFQIRAGTAAELEKVKPSNLKTVLESIKDAAADADSVNLGQMNQAAAESAKNLSAKIDPKAGDVTLSVAQQQKKENLAKRALKLAAHELLQFPVQSFGFFLAIGANVAEQAIFHYSDDPIAFEHFIQGQVDPVGQVGFYMFMLANAGASKPLMAMIENGKVNPRLAQFIPYLGMSLGMIASNITSEAGHSEGFKGCVAQILHKDRGSVNYDNSQTASLEDAGKDGVKTACDAAYANWVGKDGFWNALGRTGLDWTPSLSSLIITTIVSTAIQSGAMKIASRLITISAIEVATFFVPGGFVVKALRAVGFVANFWFFTRINNIIDPFLTQLFENWRQGRTLSEIETNLTQDLSNLKNPNWDIKNLADHLSELRAKMQAWRAMNTTEISTAQSAWVENLNNFSGLYNASKDFYMHTLDEVAKKRTYQERYESHLMRPYPLNGITPTNYNAKDNNFFFLQPNDVRDMQLNTVQLASEKLDQMYANNQAFLSTLSADGRKTLLGILDALRSGDPDQIGKAMDRMNTELGADNNMLFARVFQDTEELKALQTMKSLLGHPFPIWEKARGFTYYFLLGDGYRDSASLSYYCSFPIDDGIKVVNLCAGSLADWLIASPMWGPDTSKGESVVAVSNGFYSKFRAPRFPMANTNPSDKRPVDADILFCGKNEKVPMGQATLCRGTTEKYDNPLDFASEHVDPWILENGAFATWWKNVAETPYVNTWIDFENKYQPIVAKLIEKMWRTDQSMTNGSDVANGIFESAVQEINVNSLILGALIRTRLEQAGQDQYMQKLLSLNHPNREIKKEISDKSTLMKVVLQSNLDLNSVLQSQKTSSVAAKNSYNFIWQNYLLSELSKFEDLLRQIKVVQVTAAKGQMINAVSSQLTNKQLTDQMARVDAALKYTQSVVDVAQLTDSQKAVADLCLENMSNVIIEITNLAQVANAVSYREFSAGGGKVVAKQRCTSQHKTGNGVQFSRNKAEGCE